MGVLGDVSYEAVFDRYWARCWLWHWFVLAELGALYFFGFQDNNEGFDGCNLRPQLNIQRLIDADDSFAAVAVGRTRVP